MINCVGCLCSSSFQHREFRAVYPPFIDKVLVAPLSGRLLIALDMALVPSFVVPVVARLHRDWSLNSPGHMYACLTLRIIIVIQVGLLGMGRTLQRDLDRIAGQADTTTAEGLHYVLTGMSSAVLGPFSFYFARSLQLLFCACCCMRLPEF